jgi:hypothetical protein
VVEQSFINSFFVEYFEVDIQDNDATVNSFRVPVELLSDDPERLISCLRKVTYRQKEIIPEETIIKYKVTRENADKYGLIMLESQKFWDSDSAISQIQL